MKAQTLATDASYTDLYNLDDWSLVCAMCHYEGSHRSLLDDSAWRVACAQADGFGDLRRLKATAEYGTKEDLAQLVSEMPHASDLYKQYLDAQVNYVDLMRKTNLAIRNELPKMEM